MGGFPAKREGTVEKKFTSDEVPLAQLLNEAAEGRLQLPDFQRDWVWDDNHIVSLLASVSRSYPIGAVMSLQSGNPDVRFRPRTLRGVSLPQPVDPEYLLLDGQQRLTSLFLALRAGQAVPTRDARNKNLKRHYYIDMNAALDGDIDREEAVVSVPDDGVIKSSGNKIVLDVSTRGREIDTEFFPLRHIIDYSETMTWQLDYLQNGPGSSDERLAKWKAFNEAVVNNFVQYQVPVIQLVKSTPKEAVCQVFEKVNTGGISLTVFELVTATYAADDFNLRDDWKARKAKFDAFPVLKSFSATDFLQVVALLTTHARRRAAEDAGSKDLPAVSCKRKDILKLPLEEYLTWADSAESGVLATVPFLQNEYIFQARDLPYATQVAPLASIMAARPAATQNHGAHKKLRQWYWNGVFGEMYGGSIESRFANDLLDMVTWIDDDSAPVPRTIQEAQFQDERLLTLRSRQSAAYKGLFALQMQRGASDFRTGFPIDVHNYFSDAIDVHHIFPKKWCKANGIDEGMMDSAVNKTAIDRATNIKIGGNAPSLYTASIEKQAGITARELDAILQSHDIDSQTLREDDFKVFFNRRYQRLLRQIEQATGKPVNRSPEGRLPFPNEGESPEWKAKSISELIKRGESQVLELKATGRKNLHTQQKDPNIEWNIVKAVAAMSNSNGGSVLVGVADDGSIVGIEQDFPFLKSRDVDGWGLWLTDLLATCLNKVVAADVSVEYVEIDGLTVARINVSASAEPLFAQGKVKPSPTFYVRSNNSTLELNGPELLTYRAKRWPS